MDSARVSCPRRRCTAKKVLHLRQNEIEGPGLEAGCAALTRVAVHRIARPVRSAAPFALRRRAPSAGSLSKTLRAPKRQISVSRPGSYLGIGECPISRTQSSGASDGPAFEAYRVLDAAARIRPWGMVRLARCGAPMPQHVARGGVPVAAGRHRRRVMACSEAGATAPRGLV